MSNQTLQKSLSKRRGGAPKGSTPTRRPSTRLEGRRDGKPLIFGWGRHLTRKQKTQIQTRAVYGFASFIAVAVVGVFIFGILQQNIFIPNQPIVRVNSTTIPQDAYRKQLAFNAQDAWNRLQDYLKQNDALANKTDAASTTKRQIIQSQYQAEQGNFQQSTITQNTIDQLIEDQLIQQGIHRYFAKDAARLQPTSQAINDALKTFKAAFPAGESYASFLSQNNLSDDDVRAALAVQLRRTLMQTYLANQINSPARQLHLRRIETNSIADAQRVLDQLKTDGSDANWSKLAKEDSLDVDSKNIGGDMGWAFQGGSVDAALELWAFDPARKVMDLSPVLSDVSGTYDIVQILGADPNRTIAQSTLDNARNNALSHWLSGQRHTVINHVTTPNQDMLTSTRNLPKVPDLSATLPNLGSPAGSPGGIPGGIPGQP
jgi:hypothetical protein